MTRYDLDRAVAAIAARQAGAIARRQVLKAGGDDGYIHRRVRAERWRQWAPGVYLMAGVPPHPDRPVWLSLLAAGPGSVVSHQAAARLHRFPGFERDEGVALIVPHGDHHRIPGTFAHQIDDLEQRDVATIRRLQVTTPARTFVDLAVAASPERVRHAMEEMIVSDRITTGRVGAVLRRVARPGKPKLHVIGDILDELGPYRDGVPASALERKLVRAVLDADVGEPILQLPFPGRMPGRCRADVGLPPPMMIIEGDGRQWHARREAMAWDRRRDQVSGREGWHTSRFVWEQLEHEYDDVVDTIRTTYDVRMEQLGRRESA